MVKAFSFLEVIISVAIATVVFVAVFTLAFSNLTAAELTRDRFIAANLAQEGIEAVVNMRSHNWLLCTGSGDISLTDASIINWRGGAGCSIPSGASCNLGTTVCLANSGTDNYIVQYNSTQLTIDNDLADQRLHIDSSGRYCHPPLSGCLSSLPPSPFHRVVHISAINAHQMQVRSTVTWTDSSNRSHSVVVEDRLYNWR